MACTLSIMAIYSNWRWCLPGSDFLDGRAFIPLINSTSRSCSMWGCFTESDLRLKIEPNRMHVQLSTEGWIINVRVRNSVSTITSTTLRTYFNYWTRRSATNSTTTFWWIQWCTTCARNTSQSTQIRSMACIRSFHKRTSTISLWVSTTSSVTSTISIRWSSNSCRHLLTRRRARY